MPSGIDTPLHACGVDDDTGASILFQEWVTSIERYWVTSGERRSYSVSRLVIARQDSGATAFNASGIGGMLMGIAASNLYYPAASQRGSVMTCRISTSLTGGIMGNLMSEFWPDIRRKFFHKRMGHEQKTHVSREGF